MSKVLVIQNTRIEGSGLIGKLLEEDGFKIHSVFAKQEVIPQNDYSLLVVLGGPQSATDDYQYLRNEEKLIQNFVSKQTPVLGICLGSQLIAKSFGANVYSGSKKEIGFYNDLKTTSGSKLFSGFDNPFTVFHWHGDTYDLPLGATLLVSSKNYPNQAFQYQSAVGLQFHLEVDASMVNLWLDKTEEKLQNISYINPEKIRNEIIPNISIVENNMKKFYKNFKSEFNL